MKVNIEQPSRRRDGVWQMTITSRADLGAVWDELHDKDLDCNLKVHREKRSLDANAYAWVLIDKLSERLNIPPVDVYRQCIRQVGGVSKTGVYKSDDAEFMSELWASKGLGWFSEVLDRKTGIDDCVYIRFWFGSSRYDTAQMSRLIDVIVEECKEQGIETMTPAELQGIKDRWGEC